MLLLAFDLIVAWVVVIAVAIFLWKYMERE